MRKYINPIIEGADPFILPYNGKYYHYATNDSCGFKVSSSDDMAEWKAEGYCLKKGEGVIGDRWFWAPELTVKDGKIYMVYVAEEHLAVAVADSPLGPFKQKKLGWLSERKAIDGSFFIDDDGKAYLYYVRVDDGNVIYGAPLSDDLQTLFDDKEKKLISAELPWETVALKTAEGPFMLKHNGKYYLTFTCNDYRSKDYAVGYAVSDNPMGPFVKYEGNPILKRDEKMCGTGHHSFTTTKDGEQLLCVYHVHHDENNVHPRLTCVDKAEFVKNPDGGDDILKINVTHTPCDAF